MLGDLQIIISPFATTYLWVFPKHRFFEWEPKDEQFCRKYGIGHSLATPAAYRLDDKLILHPAVWAELKKQVPEAKADIDFRTIPTTA